MRLLLAILFVVLPISLFALDGLPILQKSPIIPSEIAEEAVLASLAAFPKDQYARRSFVATYAQAFLDFQRHGERFAHMTTEWGDEPRQKGYDTAKNRILEKREDLWLTPAEFDYSQIELVGHFRSSREISEFLTADGAKLHLNLGFLNAIPGNRQVRIKAWLSPKYIYGFGHSSQWAQEVIAIELLNEKND